MRVSVTVVSVWLLLLHRTGLAGLLQFLLHLHTRELLLLMAFSRIWRWLATPALLRNDVSFVVDIAMADSCGDTRDRRTAKSYNQQ